MEHFKVENAKDKLLDMVEDSVDMSIIKDNFINNHTKLIFPFCGKRCFNKLTHHRNKVCDKEESEYATISSWDNDGDDTTKSSVAVLIDWMTTEENCSKYFGGLDANGRTSANRKEAYHLYIRDEIKKENGKNT